MKKEIPKVSVRIAALVAAVVRERGGSIARFLESNALDASVLADADARMPLAVEQRLWQEAATACADPQFGLHAAQALRAGIFDVLDYVVRTAPTLRQALERLARYNRLLHDSATFELAALPASLRVEHCLDARGQPASAHAAEFTLASLLVVGRQLYPALTARHVAFAHAPLGSVESYARVFGLVPAFGQHANAIEFDNKALDAPLPGADVTLSRIVTTHADRALAALPPPAQDLTTLVRQRVARDMAHGPVGLARVARALHLSERSLQRKLQQEGTHFGRLLEEVREAMARRYVADASLALGEVAYLLGFADTSAFHRAFKRWTGLTPATARRQAVTRGAPAAGAA